MEPRRPEATEYHPFYATYVDLVPDRDVIEALESQLAETVELLSEVGPEGELYCYDEGKWSIREVMGHLIDAERLFGFRALHMGRGDPAPLPGMDQEVWMRASSAPERPLADLTRELELVRAGNVAMFRTFSDEAWRREGTASGYGFTVRSFPWIMAGHELHHRRILVERYLPGLPSPEG